MLQMQLRHSLRIGKPVPARYNVGGEEEEGVTPSQTDTILNLSIVSCAAQVPCF